MYGELSTRLIIKPTNSQLVVQRCVAHDRLRRSLSTGPCPPRGLHGAPPYTAPPSVSSVSNSVKYTDGSDAIAGIEVIEEERRAGIGVVDIVSSVASSNQHIIKPDNSQWVLTVIPRSDIGSFGYLGGLHLGNNLRLEFRPSKGTTAWSWI